MRKLLKLNASGIDISTKEHVVAVPEGRDKKNVRTFGTYTKDLHALAKWLLKCKVDSVAMESTGVYWYHLYTVLLEYNIEVILVNAYHVKNVPGRKSDVSDAQWLQELHTYGLLKGCFQPDNLTRELRDYVRLRKTIVKDMGRQIQRAQKALELMNIKLSQVMRDITGKSGTKMIEAMLDGERNPHVLVTYADRRLKASKENILK
jgi:transposase